VPAGVRRVAGPAGFNVGLSFLFGPR